MTYFTVLKDYGGWRAAASVWFLCLDDNLVKKLLDACQPKVPPTDVTEGWTREELTLGEGSRLD